MAEFSDGYWWSGDGLRLHYRDYPGDDEGRPPIVCLPGLTRNARDFEGVARRLAGQWRVICVDLRGRGESAYAKDPMSYVPLMYLQDIEKLFAALAITRYIAFGTSLGGILAMLLAATARETMAAAMLNDVGPVIEPAGIDRIRSYVGRSASWPTWLHAARGIAETNAAAFPNYAIEDWLAMAKRICRLNSAGRVIFDYDMKIAEPFRIPGGEAGFDMWSALDKLKPVPALLLRGARSDLLSAATAEAMVARLPLLELETVPDVGHAPTLDEPAAVAAIDRLLARVL